VSDVDVSCLVTACFDVDVDGVSSHPRKDVGPAEPCCAAALPATNAAGVDVDVLYLLDLPICRPVRWVLGWVSSSLAAAERCVGPG
jgi:hypothetical protein